MIATATSQAVCLCQPLKAVAQPKRGRAQRHRLRAKGDNNGAGSDTRSASGVSEEVLQRLRAAEQEAAALREELAAARAQSKDSTTGDDLASAAKKALRIDGGDLARESLFDVGRGATSWLNEGMDFITGGGPSEATEVSAASSAEQDTVKRRVLIGIAATVALGAFALVPTDALRLDKPSKPLFVYLVPLVRVQALLEETKDIVENARYDELRAVLERIQQSPNNLERNLRDSAASLPEQQQKQRAEALARDVIEYVNSIDSNKYYESMGTPGSRGGLIEKQATEFSLKSTKAAEVTLKEFLRLMPREELQAAQQQAVATPF